MTMRSVQDRFWSDGWIRKLNPLDRYLFLYLLTNEHSSWCGVYELDLSVMAFESGLDREELQRSMLPRLAPKVIYFDGWVYIPNWTRHHLSESGTISPTQQKGIDAAWVKVPERIRLTLREIEADGIPYAYPMGGVSPSSSALASSFTSISVANAPQVTEERDEEKPVKVSAKKYPHAKEVFTLFGLLENNGSYPKNWERNTTELVAAENLFEERGLAEIENALSWYQDFKGREYCPDVSSPHGLDSKWAKFEKFVEKQEV